MNQNQLTETIAADQVGMRIDHLVSALCTDLSRSRIQALIGEGAVLVNDKAIAKNYKLRIGDTVTVQVPAPAAVDILPQNIPLDIIYEDADMIVINKPKGMVVHPAPANWEGTLVNALVYHCGDSLSGINGEMRPGIVHRIDKDTSGLLVVAKSDVAHQSLSAQIAAHTARREYQSIVIGSLREDEGTIDKPIGRHKTDRLKMAIVPEGRDAITHYEVLQRFAGYSHMRFQLETGRTHQIRVHMASIGHAVIGDPLYGVKGNKFANLQGQCLHAFRLTLDHPITGKTMIFEAPLPTYFTKLLAQFAAECS